MNKRSEYHEIMSRVAKVRDEAFRSSLREAEKTVGMPYDGCVWHNASLAWESGRPWDEFGHEAYKAVKRMEYRQRKVGAIVNRLERHFYDMYLGTFQQAPR